MESNMICGLIVITLIGVVAVFVDNVGKGIQGYRKDKGK